MSIESMIFAKNRHMFGGMEPPEMESLSATVRRVENTSRAILSLRAVLPEDSTITNASGDVQTLCTVKGAIIRRRTDHYPVDEFDGEEIANITYSQTIEDSYLLSEEETTYYYRAFVYSDQDVYNRGSTSDDSYGKSIISVTVTSDNVPVYIFGYDLDTADSNPATRVTYPSDVDNTYYGRADMEFDTGRFDWGTWGIIAPGKKFMPRPCMLKYDGTVGEYLSVYDYSLTVEGEPSNVANMEYEGNAMMEWPKIFTKRWEENGVYHFRCSDVKIDDDWDCWCNYDINDNEIDHFYTAIYYGSYDGTRLRSISGATPYTRHTLSTVRAKADPDGEKAWHIEVLADRLLIQDLLVMMGKSTNTQAVYGYGHIVNGTEDVIIGSLDKRGMFWGSRDNHNLNNEPTTEAGVKIFGMENWWGSLPRRIDGMIGFENREKVGVKITSGCHDGTKVRGYDSFEHSDYIIIDEYFYMADTDDEYWYGKMYGYIESMRTYPWGRTPYSGGGSSSTYECDEFAAPASTSDIDYHAVLVIGDIEHINYIGGENFQPMGAFQVDLYREHNLATDGLGAMLSCKPVKIIE